MQASLFRPSLWATCLTISLLLAACASSQAPDVEEDPYQVNDPLESINRGIFAFNDTVDQYALKPVAQGYADYVPDPVRRSVRNFLNNLREPVIFANDLLQGRAAQAGDSIARLVINSTVGIGGLFDVAAMENIPFHDADFGQTLGVWGVPAGPYLVLPIFGPSNPRDTVGLAANAYADPSNAVAAANNAYWPIVGRSGGDAIDTRSRYLGTLDRIRSTSLDYYATIRSLSRQRRAAQIRHEESNALAPDRPQEAPTPTVPR